MNRILANVAVTAMWIIAITVQLSNQSFAQGNSASNIAGTEWLITAKWYQDLTGGTTVNVLYQFQQDKKVKGLVTFIYMITPLAPGDPLNVLPLNPTIQAQPIPRGTWVVKGNSISIEFEDHKIKGVIKQNQIDGTLTDKRDGATSKWTANRIEQSTTTDEARVQNQPPIHPVEPKISVAMGLSRGVYEGRYSGKYVLGYFSGDESGILRIKIESLENGNASGTFALGGLSGNFKGRIIDEGIGDIGGVTRTAFFERMELAGNAIVKGTISETHYRCSMTAHFKNTVVMDGTYLCISDRGEMKGTLAR